MSELDIYIVMNRKGELFFLDWMQGEGKDVIHLPYTYTLTVVFKEAALIISAVVASNISLGPCFLNPMNT